MSGSHTRYSDVDFRITTFHRIGLPIFPPGCRCKHHKVSAAPGSGYCNASLDAHPEHAEKCNIGGGTLRMHKALSQLLGSFCREAGLETKMESVVPEFMREKPKNDRPSKRDQERQARAAQNLAEHELLKHELAVLDVRAYHSYLPIEYLLDITIRHPSATNRSSAFPGLAAAGGEKEKFVRCPPTRGKVCTPCAIESFGRLGDHFHNFLTTLQSLARKRDSALGLPKGNYIARWLPQINATLNRALAKQLFDSMFSSLPNSSVPVPPSSFVSAEDASLADSFYGQRLFPVDAWRALFRDTPCGIDTPCPSPPPAANDAAPSGEHRSAGSHPSPSASPSLVSPSPSVHTLHRFFPSVGGD